MSPVEPSRNHVGNAAVVTVVSVVVLALGLWLAAVGLNHSGTKLHFGPDTFDAGAAKGLAHQIDQYGPFFIGDASGRKDRPILVQHLGTDLNKGWYAFLAFPPSKDADCAWIWHPSQHRFHAKCDASLTAPADGKGLSRFPATVTNGRLTIDLNADADAPAPKPNKRHPTASTTTTTPG